jgi:hypothetical protein
MGAVRRYTISASLLETQNRSLQLAERHEGLYISASGGSPTREWFRYRLCVAHHISISMPRNSSGEIDVASPRPRQPQGDGRMGVVVRNPWASVDGPSADPRCRALPPSSSSVMVALDQSKHARNQFECAHFCTGNATSVLRPYRGPKEGDRAQLGFRHILKPEGCHLHCFDEHELARCLANRAVLNIGGSVANSLQRGFERISSDANNKMRWWLDFGRTGIGANHDEASGKSHFNGSQVTTQFIHHPFRYGLANVLRPDPDLVIGPKSKAAYQAMMCRHDIVIFESGVHGEPH